MQGNGGGSSSARSSPQGDVPCPISRRPVVRTAPDPPAGGVAPLAGVWRPTCRRSPAWPSLVGVPPEAVAVAAHSVGSLAFATPPQCSQGSPASVCTHRHSWRDPGPKLTAHSCPEREKDLTWNFRKKKAKTELRTKRCDGTSPFGALWCRGNGGCCGA